LNAAKHKRTNDCDGDCRNACKNEGSHDLPVSIQAKRQQAFTNSLKPLNFRRNIQRQAADRDRQKKRLSGRVRRYGPFKLPIDNNFVSNSEGVSYPCILFSRS
jgi:hypothetical protein